MLKRLLIFFGVLLVVTALFIYFLKAKKSTKAGATPSVTVEKRKFKEFNFTETKYLTFSDPVYRLLPSGDSFFAFSDTSIFICSAGLDSKKQVINPEGDSDGNYYFFKNDSIVAGFNISQNKRYVKSTKQMKSATGEGHLLQSIYVGEDFYGVSFIPQKSKENLVVVDNWNYKTNEIKMEIILNSFLKEYLDNCKECFESTLEGNFFRIDDNAFGYFFFRGGYFMVNESGKFSIRQSIVNYPFIPFVNKKVDMPGGMTASTCQSDKDIWVQLCATADSQHIYILSNVAGKESKGRRVIDVYSRAEPQGYLYSFYAPNYKNEAPTNFLFIKNYLITSYENGGVISSKQSPAE